MHCNLQQIMFGFLLNIIKFSSSRYVSGDSMSSLLWFWHADNILCCPIQLGGEISNYTGFLPPYSFPLPLPSSLPFSMPVLGGCQILTLEAPLITEKAPCMYNGYIHIQYSKADVRSPFVKPPWFSYVSFNIEKHFIKSII
jgi:hypothetical protein